MLFNAGLGTTGGGVITTWFGICGTSASTAAKVVTCEGFTLVEGAIISVMFAEANTAAIPTLNVNSTGAKSIYVGNTTTDSTSNVLKWSAGTLLTFIYDGEEFSYISARAKASVNSPDGAGSWYGTSSTAATTAAKTSSITNYRLTPGARVSVTFSTANTYVSGALTLNINSTGAKTIYFNNAATSTTNTLLWDAGETLTFIYSGSYYYLVGRNKPSISDALVKSGVTDLNNCTTGFYLYGSEATNKPASTGGMCISIQYDTNYIHQIACRNASGATANPQWFVRMKNSSGWTTWRTITIASS